MSEEYLTQRLEYSVSIWRWCALVLLMPMASMAWAESAEALLEKPVLEKHLPLPRDPINPQLKPVLSCYEYPGLMVKQVHRGEIGAERIGLIRLTAKGKAPPCVEEPARGEIDLVKRDNSAGDFRGVKGPFVLIDAPFSVQGGLGLSVFTFDGKKLYEDLLQGDGLQQVELLKAEHPQLRLRYRHLFVAECSLYTDPTGCWQSIRQATGLIQAAAPDCRAIYASMAKDLSPDNRQIALDDPSLVVYDAEVVVGHEGALRPAKPISPAFGCWPAE